MLGLKTRDRKIQPRHFMKMTLNEAKQIAASSEQVHDRKQLEEALTLLGLEQIRNQRITRKAARRLP